MKKRKSKKLIKQSNNITQVVRFYNIVTLEWNVIMYSPFATEYFNDFKKAQTFFNEQEELSEKLLSDIYCILRDANSEYTCTWKNVKRKSQYTFFKKNKLFNGNVKEMQKICNEITKRWNPYALGQLDVLNMYWEKPNIPNDAAQMQTRGGREEFYINSSGKIIELNVPPYHCNNSRYHEVLDDGGTRIKGGLW